MALNISLKETNHLKGIFQRSKTQCGINQLVPEELPYLPLILPRTVISHQQERDSTAEDIGRRPNQEGPYLAPYSSGDMP